MNGHRSLDAARMLRGRGIYRIFNMVPKPSAAENGEKSAKSKRGPAGIG